MDAGALRRDSPPMVTLLNAAAVAATSSGERRRVADNLHDALGQLLGGIALKAQALHETLAENTLHGEAASAAEIATLVNEAFAQTRVLAHARFPRHEDAA